MEMTCSFCGHILNCEEGDCVVVWVTGLEDSSKGEFFVSFYPRRTWRGMDGGRWRWARDDNSPTSWLPDKRWVTRTVQVQRKTLIGHLVKPRVSRLHYKNFKLYRMFIVGFIMYIARSLILILERYFYIVPSSLYRHVYKFCCSSILFSRLFP